MGVFTDILSAEEDSVRKLALYALRNAGQPSTLPAIVEMIGQEEDQDVIEVALDVIDVFEEELFTRDVSIDIAVKDSLGGSCTLFQGHLYLPLCTRQ